MKHLLLFFSTFFLLLHVNGQLPDTIVMVKDTIAAPVNKYQQAWQQVMEQNKFLRAGAKPSAMPVKFKKASQNNTFFYLLLLMVLLLALLRFFYARYFNTLFRVFFNTSLRQSQLTDQLLQAKLPSLLFNAFFILSGGTYVYFLLQQYNVITGPVKWVLWGGCILFLGIIYFAKYCTLKFTGWVTGYAQTTDTYSFIIFLINKILGVVLLPFTVLMVFAEVKIAEVAALVSLLFAGLLLLLRFVRSYGLLQNQLKINRFHFLLYLAGVEIIPLLLIYKLMMILLNKNL